MRFALLLFCMLSLPALAQVYKWIDENGVTHFGSQPPAGQQEEIPMKKSRHTGGAAEKAPVPERSIKAKEQYDPVESSQNLQNEIRRLANERACKLAKLELEQAERLLTLAVSQESYDFVLDRRKKKVKYWRERADLHCAGAL